MAKKGKKWNCDGGGRAHARTLRTLGFSCIGSTSDTRWLRRGGITVPVPKGARLSRPQIMYLQATCGYGREAYLRAWRAKVRKLGCPNGGKNPLA